MSYMGYSSLEDVWGQKPHTKRSKRSKKKLAAASEPFFPTPDLADPICDLYDTKYRRKRRSKRDTYDPWDTSASIHHPFSSISAAPNSLEDDSDTDPIDEEIETFEPKPLDLNPKADVFTPSHWNPSLKPEKTASPKRTHENHDVFLYVFSGVILLFALEQFIQVGLHIGVRQLDFDMDFD